MSDQPNWHKRQEQFNKWFPAIGIVLLLSIVMTAMLYIRSSNLPIQVVNPSPLPTFLAEQIEQAQAATSKTPGPKPDKINLKSATVDELDGLSGIGPKLAQQVVILRDQGKIGSVEDLNKVKGVGPKLFAGIKDKLIWQ